MRFTRAREELGISQEEAAKRLGVSGGTVSRWERGAQSIKPRDVDAIEKLVEAKRLDETVPRGTVPAAMASERTKRIDRFGLEMARLGADDFEVDTVREAARSFLESIMSHGGTDVDAELDQFMKVSLRAWVDVHMAERKRREAE